MPKVENSQGKIFYGMHFYPGLAEYVDPIKNENYRVYVTEEIIRTMSPTFAGRPVFVEHVDTVDPDIDTLRNESDGWVIESFFNPADGKTWAKFIIVSERGLQAIERGFRLSNAYHPELRDHKGLWNGITYEQEVTGGVFEHLAIVQHPRYEESVIMTPEEFKTYNQNKTEELKKLSNSKEKKGDKTVKLNIFTRKKVENTLDFENTIVELPKSKKEMSIEALVNAMDKIENMQGYASDDHMVKVGENEMSVKDLVAAHMKACNDLEEMGKKKEEGKADEKENDDMPAEEDMEDPATENEGGLDDMGDVGDRGGDKSLDNEEEDKEEKVAKDPKKNAADKAKAIKEKAARLKNANVNTLAAIQEAKPVLLSMDKVSIGRSRYGAKN